MANQLEEAEQASEQLRESLAQAQDRSEELAAQLAASEAELKQVSEELARLRQVSGSAIETAENNRRLVEEAASMRLNLDTLSADNQRLQERARNSAFLDGALAVLLGVIITLVVPRLWPKRRSSSSWA